MRLIDIHTHGGFGVDFNNCSEDELIYFADKIADFSTVAFLPTLYTDSFDNLVKQIEKITNDISL